MPATVPEVKKALVAAGFDLYRTRANEVWVAERVRDNLIMDSGVSVVLSGASLIVRFVVRAQRSDFPGDGASALFDRARCLAAAAEQRGFSETTTTTCAVQDPADETRTLDTWYEVSFERQVAGLDDAMVEVRFALGLDKTVHADAQAT